MRSQVDRLGLTGSGVLDRRRYRLLAHVEEDERQVSKQDDDAGDTVRQERHLSPWHTPKTEDSSRFDTVVWVKNVLDLEVIGYGTRCLMT